MKAEPVLASVILLVTMIIVTAILLDWIYLGFFVGPLRFSHWMSWIGSIFIVIYTPLFYGLNRWYPKKKSSFLRIHVFGFLIAFSLISIHYAGQLSRPRNAYPPFAEGIALLIAIALLVITGVLQQFVLQKGKPNRLYSRGRNRFFHTSLVIGFYIIILVHMIANFSRS